MFPEITYSLTWHPYQGIYSLSGRTSYRNISWSLEAAGLLKFYRHLGSSQIYMCEVWIQLHCQKIGRHILRLALAQIHVIACCHQTTSYYADGTKPLNQCWITPTPDHPPTHPHTPHPTPQPHHTPTTPHTTPANQAHKHLLKHLQWTVLSVVH